MVHVEMMHVEGSDLLVDMREVVGSLVLADTLGEQAAQVRANSVVVVVTSQAAGEEESWQVVGSRLVEGKVKVLDSRAVAVLWDILAVDTDCRH